MMNVANCYYNIVYSIVYNRVDIDFLSSALCDNGIVVVVYKCIPSGHQFENLNVSLYGREKIVSLHRSMIFILKGKHVAALVYEMKSSIPNTYL